MTDFKDSAIPAPAEYASIETKPSVEEPVYADMGGEGEALYSDPSAGKNFDPRIPRKVPIPVPDLGTHVANCHSDNNSGFQDQYKARL